MAPASGAQTQCALHDDICRCIAHLSRLLIWACRTGNGADLIHDLATAGQRPDVILGISGDVGGERRALEAGADGFMGKPVVSLATFQQAILSHLPEDRQPLGPRTVPEGDVEPDPIAYRDDMVHVADVLEDVHDARTLDYIVQFLGGVARSAKDSELLQATPTRWPQSGRAVMPPLRKPLRSQDWSRTGYRKRLRSDLRSTILQRWIIRRTDKFGKVGKTFNLCARRVEI